MAQNETPTTFDRDANPLPAYEVQPGQVYRSSLGERVEVVRDDLPGSKVLLVRYPEREEGRQEARMSRYSFADAATFDGFTLVEEDADLSENEDEEEVQNLSGEFVETPRCPGCGRFMSTGYDGMGLPAASCSNPSCEAFLDDRELIRDGYYDEHA